MKLTLRIDNHDSLPDGGPLQFSAEGHGFEAGRDTSLDWTLPDPNRFVSSRHMEIRFDQGAFWLYDVSTNGTFVNGSPMRVKSPYQLEQGDRLQVGHYVIVAELSGAPVRATPAAPGATPSPFADFSEIGAPAPQPRPVPAGGGDIWSLGGGGAPQPVDPGFNPQRRPPARTEDYASQHIAMPTPETPAGGEADSPFGPASGAEPFSAPQPPTPPATSAPPPTSQGGDPNAILRAICEGAGIAPDTFLAGDPTDTAREIGRALRVSAEELANLLKARAATKQSVKSGSRTMISNDDNNPLKFVPTAEEALDVMFGTARPGYQRGAAAMRSSFDDIKRHQYGVHAAIQPALAELLSEISPEAIEAKIGSSVLSSKKTRAWELFVERWDAMTTPYENGMLDVFLAYFAEAYDAATRKS